MDKDESFVLEERAQDRQYKTYRLLILSISALLLGSVASMSHCSAQNHRAYEQRMAEEAREKTKREQIEAARAEERIALAVEETKRRENVNAAFLQCTANKPTLECEKVFFPDNPEHVSEKILLQREKRAYEKELATFRKEQEERALVRELLPACWEDSKMSDDGCDDHVRSALGYEWKPK